MDYCNVCCNACFNFILFPHSFLFLAREYIFDASASYRLSGEGADEYFSVNGNGDIVVNTKLDREKKSVYNLTASLINLKTGVQLDKDDTFIIVVMDINDNSPVFPPDISGSISESSNAGNGVAMMSMCGQLYKTEELLCSTP